MHHRTNDHHLRVQPLEYTNANHRQRKPPIKTTGLVKVTSQTVTPSSSVSWLFCGRYYMSKGAIVDQLGGDLSSTPLQWAIRWIQTGSGRVALCALGLVCSLLFVVAVILTGHQIYVPSIDIIYLYFRRIYIYIDAKRFLTAHVPKVRSMPVTG